MTISAKSKHIQCQLQFYSNNYFEKFNITVWHTGVYFKLNGVIYPNNSAAPLSHIGTDTSALHCNTNLEGCCGTPGMRHGEFYYPNGTAVPIEGEKYGMYRNRGDHYLRLNQRLPASDPDTVAGKYRCEIPDELSGETREISISL